MNNWIMLRMVVLFFLVLLVPFRLWAQTVPGAIDTPKAREIQTNVPQTPEELLLVIKALFANPDEDGHDFCEKYLGIDRATWRKSKLSGTIDDEYVGSSLLFPSAPFHYSEASLDRQNKLYKLVFTFYRNPGFLMTPAVTQKILGPPTEIGVSSPKDENSRGAYRIQYRYKTKKYTVDMTFMDIDEIHGEVPGFRDLTPEQIQKEKKNRKSFQIHKGYMPIVMEVNRFEHR